MAMNEQDRFAFVPNMQMEIMQQESARYLTELRFIHDTTDLLRIMIFHRMVTTGVSMKPVMWQNKFLARLPVQVLNIIDPHVEIVQIRKRPSGDCSPLSAEHIYLPLTCVFSVDVRMMDGFDAHLVLLGCQHAVSLREDSDFGLPCGVPRPIISGYALQLDHSILAKHPECHREFGLALRQQAQSMVSHVAITAGCNLRHSLPRRLARWLLSLSVTAASSNFDLTHEEVALFLGVRREAVTEAISQLSRAGAIHTSRGRMGILQTALLERYACDCFKLMYDRPRAQSNDKLLLQAATA